MHTYAHILTYSHMHARVYAPITRDDQRLRSIATAMKDFRTKASCTKNACTHTDTHTHAHTRVYAPITRDDQRLQLRKISERKTVARRTATQRNGAFEEPLPTSE